MSNVKILVLLQVFYLKSQFKILRMEAVKQDVFWDKKNKNQKLNLTLIYIINNSESVQRSS